MRGDRVAEFLSGITDDAAVYPFQIDAISGRVLLLRLPVQMQADAVFLDQRVIAGNPDGYWIDWGSLIERTSALEGAPGYILHVGHCGSTLVSQLVAAASGGHPLREPLPLRHFAQEAADDLSGGAFFSPEARARQLATMERLWSRNRSVVKATSMCNGLAAALDPRSPLLFVFVRPETYMTAMLGGDNVNIDLRSWSKIRHRRLAAFWPDAPALWSLSAGETAAMSWLVECASIAASGRDVHGVDFDAFLKDPAPALAAACSHLGHRAEPEQVEAAVSGPLMRRYAKAPDHPYDAAQRRAILAEDRARLGPEIDKGLAWLDRAARRFPAGEAAMAQFSA